MSGNGDDFTRNVLPDPSYSDVPFFTVDGVEHPWGIEADIEQMGPVRKGIYIDPERVAIALDAEIRWVAGCPVNAVETAALLSAFQLVRRWLLGEELEL